MIRDSTGPVVATVVLLVLAPVGGVATPATWGPTTADGAHTGAGGMTSVGVGSAGEPDGFGQSVASAAVNAAATTLVVDGEADGDDQYATIQAAVDNASDGDTVEVRPGTYPGAIDLGSNISLVAPDGATLGVSSEGSALTISSSGSVTVAGFSIRGAGTAIEVNSETGDILLRNLRIRNVSGGITAWTQGADVTVRNVSIRRSGDAIYARDTSGTWVITGSTIANNSRRGIHGGYSTGDWTIRDSVIRNNSKGIIARSAGGDWSVHRNVITGNEDAEPIGTGIDAADAQSTVNATRNWWGNASGPTDRQCGGNVNCSNWLEGPPSGTDSSGIVVDGEADGDGEYATIQAAVDNASDGDRVVVRNGTYHATVSVSKDVTIIAPNGATLDGSTDAFTIGYYAEPTIAGFTIVGYSEAIAAQRTVGAWTVRNLTVRDTNIAIAARESKGNWSAIDVTVNRSGTGVDAVRSEGAWTVRDSTFRNLKWWAVGADDSTGDWRVLGSTIVDSYLGILARDTTGRWQVHYNTITGNGGSYSGGTGVFADGAATRGNATLNWWGQPSGAMDGQCSGNVTCANPLQQPPGDRLIVDGEADGDGEYATIQAAVDNASDGDRVVVRNGTYRESLRVDRNVSVVAPNGATLDGSSLDGYYTAGVLLPAGSAVEPTIAGFTITGFTTGIDARRTTGAWHVRNVTVRNSSCCAVYAMETTGSWRLTDVRLRGSGSAEWGVLAQESDGSWAITGGSIAGYTVGIDVADPGTTANWSVHRATITENAEHGIDAENASSIGDATDNWWGQSSGPTESQCVGNVTCTPALDSPPGESGSGGDGGSDEGGRVDIDPRIVTNARASDIEAEEALLLQGVAAIPTGVTVATRSWRFGDGENATGRRVTHRYDSSGTYTVTYSVTTEAGETYTASKAVTIQPASQSFRITSISPVVRGTEVRALTLVEGTEFPLRYRVTLTQPENASRVEFALGNITHTDTDGSDGWTFPVNPTRLNRDRTLRVRAVNERGPNATRARRVRVLETPEWFEAFQLQNVVTSEGEFVYKRVLPGGGRSSTLPIPDKSSSGASIPIAGKAQSSTVKVVMIVTVDFATAQGTATIGGKITYKLVALKAKGKVSGTAVVDLAAGDIERAYLNASASAKAKYPPPPTGIPSPPIGPVPPGVVSIYPIFSAGVNTSAVFDERDEIGSDERLAFEFRRGTLTAEVGAKQEIGKRWKAVRLVVGMSESVRATTPIPEFDTVDGRISAELYAKAIAYMIKLEVSIPPGDRKFLFRFSSPRLPGDGRGFGDVRATAAAARSGWTVRSATGKRPPKPGTTAADGPLEMSSTDTAASASTVASVGAVTNDTVADESPTVTRTDGGVTVLWSRHSRGKSALNGRDVFLSRANVSGDASATSFSEPVALTDDRVSDVSPAAATTAGNDSLAAFLTFTRRFARENVSSPTDLYPHGEIRVATNAGDGWSAPARLTDDDDFDYRPTVAAAGGRWVVAWVSDADANLTTRTDQRVEYVRYDSDGALGPVRTIEDARAVTATSTAEGVVRLAYLAMGNASHNGSVVVRSIDPGTGATETVAAHEVRRLGGLAAAGATTAWVDLGADGEHLSTASNGTVSSLPLPADVGVPQAVHLTGRADGTVLAHVRAQAGATGPARVLYTARVDGEWLPVRTYANGTAGNLTFWQGDSVALDGGFLSAFAGKDLRTSQRHDIYVFEQRFRPDVTVDTTVADANASVGAAVTLNYTVRNLGDAAARNVTVAVRNGSGTATTRTIARLGPGEARTASITTTLGPGGTVAAVVDPADRATEHDERNNSDAVRLAVPDLAVRSVSAAAANETVAVTVAVANPTAVAAPATTVRVASGPNASKRVGLAPLAPGATRNVTVVLPRDALSPARPVRVVVDPGATVPERSARNNARTAAFPLPDVGISPGSVNYARDPETGALTASVVVSNRGLLPAAATVSVAVHRDNGTEVVARRPVTVPGADATGRRAVARVLLPLGTDSGVVANDTVEVTVSAPHDAVAGNNVVSDRVAPGGTLLAPSASIAVSDPGASPGNVTVEATRVADPDGTVTAIRWIVNGSVIARNRSSVRVPLPERGRVPVAVVLVDDDGLLTRVARSVGRAPNVSAIDSDTAPPTDPDLDGQLEDVNGNGRVDFDDVVELLGNLNDPVVTDHPAAFDFNGNGRLDFDDIVTLFGLL